MTLAAGGLPRPGPSQRRAQSPRTVGRLVPRHPRAARWHRARAAAVRRSLQLRQSDRLPHLSEREQEPRPGPTNLLAGLSREAVVGGGAGLTQGKDVLELGDRLADLSFLCRDSREIKSRQQARLIQRPSQLVGADPSVRARWPPASPPEDWHPVARHTTLTNLRPSQRLRWRGRSFRSKLPKHPGSSHDLTPGPATKQVRVLCASGGSPFRAEHGGDQPGLDACATTEADVQGRDGRTNDRRACLPLLRA
jgi:hypothetical protein